MRRRVVGGLMGRREELDGSTDVMFRVSETKFCCLDLHIFPFSSNCQRIDATTAKNEHQFLAPSGVSQRRGCLSLPKNFTEHVLAKGKVTALASRLAMPLHSVPLNCPLVSCSPLPASCRELLTCSAFPPGPRMFRANPLSEDLFRAGGGDVE